MMRFDPQDDITPAEVVMILKALFGRSEISPYLVSEEAIGSAARHFMPGPRSLLA